MKKNVIASVVKEPMAQVVNPSIVSVEVTKQKRVVKRNLFTVAKSKTIALYEKVSWISGESLSKEILFKKCLIKTLEDMEGYNEYAFKKDIAMHMAFLLNDRRFQRTCWDADWSLFEISQRIAWAKSSDFQRIRDFGLDHVSGFNTPGYLVYEEKDLEQDLKALGFDESYFHDNPYSKDYKTAHPTETAPRL